MAEKKRKMDRNPWCTTPRYIHAQHFRYILQDSYCSWHGSCYPIFFSPCEASCSFSWYAHHLFDYLFVWLYRRVLMCEVCLQLMGCGRISFMSRIMKGSTGHRFWGMWLSIEVGGEFLMLVLRLSRGLAMFLSLRGFMRILVLLRKAGLLHFRIVLLVRPVYTLYWIFSLLLQDGKQILLNLILCLIEVSIRFLMVARILFRYFVEPCHIVPGIHIPTNLKILQLVWLHSFSPLYKFLFMYSLSFLSFMSLDILCDYISVLLYLVWLSFVLIFPHEVKYTL